MNEFKTKKVGIKCLLKARRYARVQNWPKALQHYLMGIEIFPNEKDKYLEEIIEVLYQYGILLECEENEEEIYKCYVKSLEFYPTCLKILNNFGEHLLRMKQPYSAFKILKTATEIDPADMLIERNLLTAKVDLIPRWHFRMLNDIIRNKAYRDTIRSTVSPEFNKVIDIGAGCGILSYYASECPDVRQICAVEVSLALSNIAKKALNNVCCNLSVINKHSTQLTASEVGLSNLLVTEIFDAGLFGEHALETLIHAWENLLEPSAKVIPAGASLYVTGFSNTLLLSQHRFSFEIPKLCLSNVCVTRRTSEPYNAENLKHKKVTYLTNTHKALHINFYNLEQLRFIYTNWDAIPPFTLIASENGRLDGFVIWFDLHLDDNNTITTNPSENSVTCWEQAIIYLDHPLHLKSGQSVRLQLSCVNNKLLIDVIDPKIKCKECFKVSPEIITFLNERQIIETSWDSQLSKQAENHSPIILDFNPVPIYSLCLAKNGYNAQYKIFLPDPRDRHFFNYIFNQNGIVLNNDADKPNCISIELCDDQQMVRYLNNKIDMIFYNPITQHGTLCEKTFQRMPQICAAIRDGGKLFPSSVDIYAEVIDSQYLNHCTKVDDENLFGFQIADAMNEFSVLEQWEVEPLHYERKTLLDCFIASVKLTKESCGFRSLQYKMPVEGVANGILYWFKLNYIPQACTNTYNSIHYKGACFMFRTPQVIKRGENIVISVKQSGPLLKITNAS